MARFDNTVAKTVREYAFSYMAGGSANWFCIDNIYQSYKYTLCHSYSVSAALSYRYICVLI